MKTRARPTAAPTWPRRVRRPLNTHTASHHRLRAGGHRVPRRTCRVARTATCTSPAAPNDAVRYGNGPQVIGEAGAGIDDAGATRDWNEIAAFDAPHRS